MSSMNRREFLQILAAASAAGFALNSRDLLAAQGADKFYDLPRYGNVHFLHFTDCHAQLMRSISASRTSISASAVRSARRRTSSANTCSRPSTSNRAAARRMPSPTRLRTGGKTYGKVGGFAHLATLVKQVRASRPGALLLDGGDTWQGSYTALQTKVRTWSMPASCSPST